MSQSRRSDLGASPRHEPSAADDQSDHLTQCERNISRRLVLACSGSTVDLKEIARFLALQSRAVERRLALCSQMTEQANRRADQAELRLAALSRRVSEQDEALKTMCQILKDLDEHLKSEWPEREADSDDDGR
jgi:hypothetical protein